MPERIPQSVAKRVVFRAFYSPPYSDAYAVALGQTIAITISKNGGAFGNPSAGATNATEISAGFYYFDLSTTDTNTKGPLAWKGSASEIDDAADVYEVVNATNAGFTALPDAAAGASGGTLINGSNSGTVTLAALTVTGQLTVSNGIVVTVSTTNKNAITATGNGAGVAAQLVSGANAASALNIVNAATNGDAVLLEATGSGHAIDAVTQDGNSFNAGIGGSGSALSANIVDQILDEPVNSEWTVREALDRIDVELSSVSGGGSSDWTADERTAIRAILGIPGSGTTPDDPTTGILDTIRDNAVAIKAKTDNLPTDPADASDISTAFGALNDLSQSDVRAAVGLASANLDAQLAALPTATENATELLDTMVNSESTVQQALDRIDVEVSSAGGGSCPSAADIRIEIDSNSTKLAAIVADTNELQTDWADGGRLDSILDARASQTSVDDVPTNAEFAAALAAADDATLAAIAALPVTVLTTQMTESYRANGAAPTIAQAFCELLAHHGEASNSGTTKTLKKFDHSTTAATFTYDDADNPSSVTRAS